MIIYPPLLKRGITLIPWLTLIPRWAKDNAPYLAHEQAHAGQQRKYGIIYFWFKYLTNGSSRQSFEVEAYKAQIANGAPLGHCAYWLATGYGLGLSVEQANELLRT